MLIYILCEEEEEEKCSFAYISPAEQWNTSVSRPVSGMLVILALNVVNGDFSLPDHIGFLSAVVRNKKVNDQVNMHKSH